MLRGIAVSEGIGIGRAYIVKNQEVQYEPHQVEDTESEIVRFQNAVETFCVKTEQLAQAVEKTADLKEAEIIRGHIQMLKDPYMLSQIEDQIKGGTCAEAACGTVLDTFIQIFSQVDDELTQQRAADVKDIKKRMLNILLGIKTNSLAEIPPGSILVVEDLVPSMTAEINRENVCGIAAETGGMTSHSAILARAMEIPAVLSVDGVTGSLEDGDTVIVDGNSGTLVQNPKQEELDRFKKEKEENEKKKKILENYMGKNTKMADGQKKDIFCNIGNPQDAVTASQKDGEGIGLFRTEFLFMDKQAAPTEEEQFEAYKKAAQTMGERPVIIRTLDVGGDKEIPYLNLEKEDNPFLGFRAVRYCLDNRELYETQLRAIIRASAFGNIKIMVPLVTNAEEIRKVKNLTAQIIKEYEASGVACDPNLQVGIMVETPAAAIMADLLAKESDFFSIGTNDLTQYIMAADRGNSRVAYLNKTYDPAVLRAIRHIIRCGKEAGIPVGMCGEAAADPHLIPLLLAFGLDEFSVSPASVLAARYSISKWTQDSAEEIAKKAMGFGTADEVETYLKNI